MNVILVAAILIQARVPGATVRAWQLDQTFHRYPSIVSGQNANAYFVAPHGIEFNGTLSPEYKDLRENFFGSATAQFSIPEAGTYRFRLQASKAADLYINNERVCDTLDPVFRVSEGVAEGQYKLARGRANIRIRFLHESGPFKLRLMWKRPTSQAFEPVPPALLTSEAGQTFVTSPGVKRATAGIPSTKPGDGRPLEAVHPSFTLQNFRGPNFQPGVGGMAFLPDGRLAICTWDEEGAVYLIDSLNRPTPRVHNFATGLGEPLGLAHYNGDLYVTQKGEITRLRDTDGNGVADEYRCVSAGWPVSQNYHEFTFNLVPFQGVFYITSSVPLRSGQTNYMPGSHGAYSVPNGPGSWIKVDPKTGAWERLAKGMRTPNGMNIGVDGRIFVAENQGSWVPASALYVMEPGAHYLHPESPTGTPQTDRVAVWFPHGEVGNSPSQMVLIPDGMYRGQMLIGDVTYGGLQRIMLEKVGGQYQGAVFKHSQGLEAGVNRMVWGPDGSLYVGGVGSNGDWNHAGHKFGLQRLKPNGKVPFEIHEIRTRRNGFAIRFTKELAANANQLLENLKVRQWRYQPTLNYGGPKIDDRELKVVSKSVDDAMGVINLELEGLKPGHVVYFNFRGLKSNKGEYLWSPEAWYTLNKPGSAAFDADEQWRYYLARPVPRQAEVLIGPGARTKLVKASNKKPCDWIRRGEALEVLHDASQTIGANDMVSPKSHGDIYLHMEWLSPPGGDLARQFNGNSGVKLQSRYEIQIMNAPGIVDALDPKAKFNEAGSVYRLTPPKFNASYGAGVWQTYDIWFTAAKWEADKKVANARVTLVWNGVPVHVDQEMAAKTGASVDEGPNELPLLLQDHESGAEGGVLFRNVWYVKDPEKLGAAFWPPRR